MKDKEIINLFNHVHPDTLAETDLGSEVSKTPAGLSYSVASAKHRRFPWRTLAAVAATLAIVIASVLTAGAPQPALGLASPEYPQGVSFYDYEGKRAKRQELDPQFLANLSQFAVSSATQVFADGDPAENSVYSPLSLFMALALTSGGARGETQAQLLQALRMPDIELVNAETSKLFKHLHTDNEVGKLLLANSLWLQEGVEFNQAFLGQAARDYYAHSFGVDFAESSTAQQMSQWVSKHTGGKLGNDPQAFQPDPAQIMSLINTVYFYDQWNSEFNRDLTKEAAFNLADGGTVTVPFMNSTSMGSFAQVSDCLVTSLGFKNDQQMLLILPDEGVSPYDILTNPVALEQVLTSLDYDADSCRSGEVVLSLPKFNFTAKHNLGGVLQKLGIQEAFTPEADFSGLAATKPLFISDVQQSLSISIDEKGCEATAYTEIRLCGSALPEDTIEMKLDRPFIFAITGGAGDAPLFIGVVNNPAK